MIGEAAGQREIILDLPFAGDAGALLNRALYQIDRRRDDFRVYNTIQCKPPGNELDGAWYEQGAAQHCSPNLESVLGESDEHLVVVPMGGVAIRRLLGLSKEKFKVQDFHGTVNRDHQDRFWVVPTFHPSHINRGSWNLFGTFQSDLKRAIEISETDYQQVMPGLQLDPPVEWFAYWVMELEREASLAPDKIWLACDIETPDKEHQSDEGELGAKDRSYIITRINFSSSTDEGITVPFRGEYLPWIKRALLTRTVKCFWNEKYDLPRLRYHDYTPDGKILDFMWGWHVLQSDLPRGLGFVAPFYSDAGPWKHLFGAGFLKYCAMDGVQTLRCAHGIARDLQRNGQWEAFYRHVYRLETLALQPSERVGLLVDQPQLDVYGDELTTRTRELYLRLQDMVPERLKPLLTANGQKGGWKKKPKEEEYAIKGLEWRGKRGVVAKEVEDTVSFCTACGLPNVTRAGRCGAAAPGGPDGPAGEVGKGPSLRHAVGKRKAKVLRYFVHHDYNPSSSPQKLSVIASFGDKPGKNRKTKKPSADKKTYEDLRKRSKTAAGKLYYATSLTYGEMDKLLRTYVHGTKKKLAQAREGGDESGRLKPTVTHKPSTLRTSYTSPNLQNVAGRGALAAGFRKCLVAAAGCKLVAADYAGIEAVLTGWCAKDPDYIRLAWLGVHAYLASHVLKRPADLGWSDEELGAYFAEIKSSQDPRVVHVYDMSKRTIHGTNYGLTPFGMNDRFPDIFPTKRDAERVQKIYFEIAPKIAAWQSAVRERADKKHFLGGSARVHGPEWAHPFAYKHWFFDVKSLKRIPQHTAVWRERNGYPWMKLGEHFYSVQYGEDWKRCVAFFPQSIAAGIIKEAALQLFDPENEHYIGDAFYGDTPLRAIVHDEFLSEVPDELIDRVVAALAQVMRAPIPQLPCPPEWGLGEFLKIGVEIKVGQSWAKKDMQALELPKWGVAADSEDPEDAGDPVEWDEEEEDDFEREQRLGTNYGGEASYGGAGSDADVPF